MSHGEMAANVAIICSVAADRVFSWCSKFGASRKVVAEQSQLDARWDGMKSPIMKMCILPGIGTAGLNHSDFPGFGIWWFPFPGSSGPLHLCTLAHTCEMVTPHEWEMLGKTLPTLPWDLAIVSLSRQQQQYTALGRICHEFALSVEQKRSGSQLESHPVCCRENLNVQAL